MNLNFGMVCLFHSYIIRPSFMNVKNTLERYVRKKVFRKDMYEKILISKKKVRKEVLYEL